MHINGLFVMTNESYLSEECITQNHQQYGLFRQIGKAQYLLLCWTLYKLTANDEGFFVQLV